VTTLYTTLLTPLTQLTANVGTKFFLSAANKVSGLKISVSNPSYHQRFPEQTATDASNRSICCTNNVRLHVGTDMIQGTNSAVVCKDHGKTGKLSDIFVGILDGI
jgi:hypothetical protein